MSGEQRLTWHLAIQAAILKEERERVKENYKLKGCHAEILSLLIICGNIAGQPAICNGYK